MGKKPLALQQPPPEQVEEDESSSEEEDEDEDEEESSSSSDVEEKKEKPKAPQNQAPQLTKKQSGIVEKQITPPPPSAPQNQAQAKKSKIVERQPTPPPPTQPLADGEGGSESEDEGSVGSPSASDFTIKVNSPKKPASKDAKPSFKRPPEGTKSDDKDVRGKKKAKTGEEDLKTKKSATGSVGRVCSEEDVIRILNGMIDYQKQKGSDPTADIGAFYEFVRGNLQAEITKVQLYEKVRRLRIKYFKNVGKTEKGENVDFTKPHESQIFGLSKKFWGRSGMTTDGVHEKGNVNGRSDEAKSKKSSSRVGNLAASPKKQKKIEKKNIVLEGEEKDDDGEEKKVVLTGEVKDDDGEKNEVVLTGEVKDGEGNGAGDDGGDFEKKYPFTFKAYASLSLGGLMTADQVSFLKANLSSVGSSTLKEFEVEWKELHVEETEILLKRFQMFADHTRRVLDGMKK